MLRVYLFQATVLLFTGVSIGASAGFAIPENPRWKPIVDEMYLQEVGSRIETERPLLAVAVLDDTAYVGDGRGVHRVEDGKLVHADGPRSEIRRLRVLDGVLWAMGLKGLWRYADGAWSQIGSGAYVDVCLHAGDVVAASGDHVYRLQDGKLVLLDHRGSRAPILGIASYSETIYMRHADRVGFLHNGRYNYNNVQDWGHLTRTSTTRDMMAFGPQLLVPTDMGLAELRGMTWRTLTGEDGLCYEDTTCVAAGFDRDYWVGTTRGAIRAVNGDFHYFGYERWIPHDKVNAIACGDKVAYIATDGGLGIITYEPYTLQKKSAWYKRWINEWGMKRLGFINTLIRNEDGTYTRFLGDNDGGWACHYLDALCFEYAVTGDPEVREEAVDVFKTIKWTEEITPMSGFPARAVYAVGEPAIKTTGGSAGRAAEWNLTEDGKWEWKGDTSSDEVASQYYTTAVFYELVAEGKEKDAAREHMQRITDHIIDNGWVLRDYDGKPTVWARWEPDFIFSPQHTDERGLNSGQALNIIAIAQHIVGGEKYERAQAQLLEWRYPQNMIRTKITFPGHTHFDDRLAFLGYYPLLNYETDPDLRAVYMRSMQRGWECKRFENQTWFNYIYGALTGNECQNEAAVQHLRDYPLDCTSYRFTNSHRHDLQVPKGYTNYVTDTKAMGPREQGIRRWDRDPLELDGGGGHGILDPSSYLDAYWMGRYYGFIKAPTTTAPNLLTVEKRHVRRGTAPYDHTPRPHIF
ncbi:MAG: hypothetical protein ACC628_22220 [Pirellulaceae bacterium]